MRNVIELFAQICKIPVDHGGRQTALSDFQRILHCIIKRLQGGDLGSHIGHFASRPGVRVKRSWLSENTSAEKATNCTTAAATPDVVNGSMTCTKNTELTCK